MRQILFLSVLACFQINVSADTLRLKAGGSIQGILISANSREISFLGPDGAQKTYSIDNVAGIDFTPAAATSISQAKPKAAPPAAPVMTIPAGTQITIRMIDSISGKTAKPGAVYRASIDEPVAVGSHVAIPDNSSCTVEVVHVEGGNEIALRLRNIKVGAKTYSTSTEYAEVEATGTSKKKKAFRRGIGLGALGAGIGALAGGGSGAAIGAAVGGGAGAISAAAAKGKQLELPAETRLIFALKAPVPLN